MTNNVAFIFPGQGSQSVGMGKELAQAYPAANAVFAQADELLGFSLSQLAWEGPEEALNDTVNTQPALFTHSAAALAVLDELLPGILPAYTAGHSMGELSALLASGALDFPNTLTLVRRRGELMKLSGEISPGGMAAVLGLDIPTLERVCAEASQAEEIVQVANDNCPGQVVISGDRLALSRAIGLAQSAGARRAKPLAVSIAAHSPLMAHVQEAFNQAVKAAPILPAKIAIIANVNASPMLDPEAIRQDLCSQLSSRVRWTESVQFMIDQGIDTFIEVGTGNVLAGLIKRINSEVRTLACGTPADIDKILSGV